MLEYVPIGPRFSNVVLQVFVLIETEIRKHVLWIDEQELNVFNFYLFISVFCVLLLLKCYLFIYMLILVVIFFADLVGVVEASSSSSRAQVVGIMHNRLFLRLA